MPPRKKKAATSTQEPRVNTRQPLTRAQLAGLPESMRTKFNWDHDPYPYQMLGIEAQLQMWDALVHAGTGMGKTTIAAGPHAHETSAGKVTLMISPLIALHDEQVDTFRDEFKLKVMAVNSSNGGCKPEVLEQIVRGEYQIVLISPEMALSRRFICHVLRSSEFGRRVLSVVVDEAHVVSHWGTSFRKKYGTLGMLRAFLPRGMPVVALSTTLPARIRNDVLSKLQFGKNYVNIDVGNDRPNVSLIVRAIQHPIHTYADLNFTVAGAKSRTDIKKTFIYADNIATGVLKEGHVRILVCTNAAGMGCNIPNIDVVVQWKLPASMSIFVQRAGRAARARGSQGVAILLVEPSAYTIDLAESAAAKTAGGRAKRKGPEKEKETDAEKRQKSQKRKAHANARGVRRGGAGGKHDAIFVADTPPLDPEAMDEGLLVFVQTGKCRRAVLTLIYQNKPPQPLVPCCDICCPGLLDSTRPGKPPVVPRQSAVKRGEINPDVPPVLHEWRVAIKARDFPSPLFALSAILCDETIALLSSVGPIQSREHLQKVLAGQWTWWEEYGEELYSCLAALDIPPMKPLPKKQRTNKRAPELTSGSQTAAIAAPQPVRQPRKKQPAKSREEIEALNRASFLAESATVEASITSASVVRFRGSQQSAQNSNGTS
ncbi:P-loop containing nucleoside triphosphate hydrolase protein [Mycena maculata]|uniref:DNA 3'-5' helicase n=1 Tax=Mycena maculata TaxID=230809 RepID=A0AAD7NIV3_9AGAR|nr:P-loop containing nucleoside triphosphate hydrolase protein [Mycena maculata]